MTMMSEPHHQYPDAFPTLAEFGFSGGRDGLRALASRVFTAGGPRFLQDNDGHLVVLHNRDLQRMAAHPEVGGVPPGVLFGDAFGRMDEADAPTGAEIARVVSNQVFTFNAPIHRPVRKALVARLGPKQVSAMAPLARDVVDVVLKGVADRPIVDAIKEIAEPVTCMFWGRLLDMTASEIDAMEGYVRELTPLFQFDRTAREGASLDQAMRGYWNTIRAAAERCLARGANELVVQMAADLAAIDLQDDPDHAGIVPRDVGAMLAGNLIDAFHTAALASANALYALAERPDVLRALALQPDLLPAAIFEALRIEPPVIMLNRWATDDLVYEGVSIAKGSTIVMMWGMGGFDPVAFADPLRFDLSRSRQGSTTFGGGGHICPGRYAAAMLVQVLVEEMLKHRYTFEMAGEPPTWITAHVMGQMTNFPLRLAKS